MTASESMFLTLCQELNFHRAAQRCFVTQQGLSDHIRRLEELHGVQLFQRKPRVALTPAGEALRRVLERERVMEQDLARELEQLTSGRGGKVTLGINGSRAQIMLPGILEQFRQLSPEAELTIRMEDTRRMEQELEEGTLDCYIGVNAPGGENRVCVPLTRDSIYLLAHKSLLDQYEVRVPKNVRAVELEQVKELPFVRNLPGSTLNETVDKHLRQKGIGLREIAAVSDYKIQLEFCTRGWAAMFCPQMLLDQPEWHQEQLVLVPITGLEHALRIDLVYDRERIYPACVKHLFTCIEDRPWQGKEGQFPSEVV